MFATKPGRKPGNKNQLWAVRRMPHGLCAGKSDKELRLDEIERRVLALSPGGCDEAVTAEEWRAVVELCHGRDER